jgi:septal ring factor EnvC (AmiA/AmiB activator)
VALTARRRAAQAQLAGDAAAAERRARALAAEARSLRELAQRAAANARARPGGGSAGPSVIPAAWVVPAEGSITRGFGARDGAGAPSQGVILRTRAGAQVVSPAAGEVTYAGVFRSYGQVLILNLDGGYALVLTGLHTIRTRVGETVRAGQPVGEMTASDTPAPELYVEVRRDGRAVDPGRWLNGRGTTAGPNVRAG